METATVQCVSQGRQRHSSSGAPSWHWCCWRTATPSSFAQGRELLQNFPCPRRGNGCHGAPLPSGRGLALISRREDEKTFSWLEILQTRKPSRLALKSSMKAVSSRLRTDTDFRKTWAENPLPVGQESGGRAARRGPTVHAPPSVRVLVGWWPRRSPGVTESEPLG